MGDVEFPATQRFTLQRRIGNGRAGVVFQAIDEEVRSAVALKVLRRADPPVTARVESLFRALAALRHSNLVTLHDLFRADDRAYFTMELVEGLDILRYAGGASLTAQRPGGAVGQERTLTAPLLSGGAKRFDEIRVNAAMLGLAKALSALHGKGLWHGEVRPANVRVTPQGRVVLLEAVASEIGAAQPAPATYLAPEQTSAPGSPPRPAGPPADWYAMGCLLYEALTGMPPFHGAAQEILAAKRQQSPPPPGEVAPGIPESLNELCTALLETAPERRPSDSDVMAWLSGRRPRSRPPEPRPQARTDSPGGAVLGGAAAASTPPPAPPPPATRALAGVTGQPPFVGRRGELDVLREALARSGRGVSAVVVSGPPGIGKTALLGRFLFEAEKAGALCFSGRCHGRLCTPHNAFAGIVGAVAAYLVRRGSPLVEQVLPQRSAALALAFPELLQISQVTRLAEEHPAPGDPQEARHQALGALLELLARLSQQQPLALAVDDLHEADGDSLEFLDRLLAGQEGLRLLLVGTRRAELDEPPDPFLAALGLGEERELPLGPLPPEEAMDLVRRMPLLPGMGSSTTAEGVVRTGNGVPLCLLELLRQPTASGAGRPAPASLGEAIAARLFGLDPLSRRLLEAVALAGGPIPLAAAARACAAVPESLEPSEAYLPLLPRLRAEGLLEGGDPFVDVAHEAIREVAVAGLPALELPERHRRLAAALLAERERGARPGLIALHLQRAGSEDTAAEALREAADTAASHLAFELAAALYRRGLKLTGEPRARRLLHLGLATALAGAGRMAEVAQALWAAADGAGPFERTHLLLAAGEHLLSAGLPERALALFADLCPEAAPPIRARSSSAARRELALQKLRGGLGWKVRPSATVTEEEVLEPEAMRAVGAALWPLDPARGAALIARAGRRAAKLGEPIQVALGMALEATSAAMLGKRRRARALAEQALAAAGPAAEEPLLRAMLEGYEGLALHHSGEFRAAAEKLVALEDHKDVVTLTGWRLGPFRLHRLWALSEAGLYAELAPLLEGWLHEAARRKDAFMLSALARVGIDAWLARDEPQAALRKLEATAWAPPWPEYHPLEWAELLARASLALYAREGGKLRETFGGPLRAVPGWLLGGAQLARCRTWFLVGRLSLMDGSMGGEARPAVAEAAQMARSLEREGVPYASVWALLLRAGVAYQKMDFNRAALRLREAIAGADQAEMLQYAVAGRRRLGELIGGEEGASLVRQANEALGRQGVKNPKRLSDALAPGLRT